MQTIYVDVLIILNIYVNYLLLRTTGKLTHSRASVKRCLLASAYGSLYSLLILVPNLNAILNILLKIIAAATIVPMAFGYKSRKRYVVNMVCFLASNFIFAGVVYAVYIWLEPSFMQFNNTYFYVDFSLFLLIGVTTALYTSLCVFRYFMDRFGCLEASYKLYIKYKGETVNLSGIADTGNSLVDFFSGKPVIICSDIDLKALVNVKAAIYENKQMPRGFRLIPYKTIGNSGMLPIFTPDEILIENINSGERKSVEAMIGIRSGGESGIFNPALLKL